MPAVYPFHAVPFKSGAGDISSLVAPPYDVLDAASKKALIMKDQHNIAAIDLWSNGGTMFYDDVSLTQDAACFVDCDESGALDIQDFVCFQNAFALGCP